MLEVVQTGQPYLALLYQLGLETAFTIAGRFYFQLAKTAFDLLARLAVARVAKAANTAILGLGETCSPSIIRPVPLPSGS
jgi:hypothetical protein